MDSGRLKDMVRHVAVSDVGIKRSHNQDAYGALAASSDEAWRSRGHLFIVADGMGAHAVGELASKLAVDTVTHSYQKGGDASPVRRLKRSILEANRTVHEKGRQNADFAGMGTTCTAIAVTPEGVVVGHIGDSRCYRIRGGRIQQITFDHSLQWETARRQKVDPDTLKSIPSNILARSLGPERKARVDSAGPYAVEEGDRFLLCSDGASGLLSDGEIGAITAFLPLEEAAQCLVDLANLRGGIDNITVVLVQIGDDADDDAAAAADGLAAAVLRRLGRLDPTVWLLVAGVVLFLLGSLLGRSGWYGPFIALFAVFVVYFVGLVGYATVHWLIDRRNASRLAERLSSRGTPVYRERSCTLDEGTVSGLAGLAQQLRELANDEQWPLDWEEVQAVRQKADANFTNGELADAFRQYCRCIGLFSAGMPQRQGKQEVFDPSFFSDRARRRKTVVRIPKPPERDVS